MESLFAKSLPGLEGFMQKGWFAAMGIIGLLLLFGLLIFGTPFDGGLAGAIAAAFIGIGFGEAECRTFRTEFRGYYGQMFKCTIPAWRLTVTGFVLHLIGWTGAVIAAWKVFAAL